MSIGSAILNQGLSRAASGLKKVMGNLPSSALSGTKSAFGGGLTRTDSINLQYPMNVENDIQQGHYIMFFINSSEPAEIQKAKTAHAAALAEYNDLVESSEGEGYYQEDPPKLGTSTLDSAPDEAIVIKRKAAFHMVKAISLYMPPQVKATYSMAYQSDAEIGAGTQALAGIIQDLIAQNASGQTISQMFMDKENWKKAGLKLGDATITTLLGLAKGVETVLGPLAGLQGGMGAAGIASGLVMTNKMELLFTGVNRRKFSFSFTFIPKSEKESEAVTEIIYTFKRYMTPSFAHVSAGPFKGPSGQGRLLNIPNTFDIQYMYQGKDNPWINRISTCYLLNMDVQYGSDKAGFYEPLAHPRLANIKGVGPPPTHTTISLNFEEIEKMSRTRIDEGF